MKSLLRNLERLLFLLYCAIQGYKKPYFLQAMEALNYV